MQLPVLLVVGVVGSWVYDQHWIAQARYATAHGLRLLTGQYSLYQANTHITYPFEGYWFGAINPGAFAASRHLPPGTPIWSTNVDAYCMVPDCVVKSMASYETPKLDTILTAAPSVAKTALQQAGLNYFLFQKDFRIIDPLPFSPLFAPETISQYFGIKWTDGLSFLLTWLGPGVQPLGWDFFEAYTAKLAEPENPWFQFRTMLHYFADAAASLRTNTKFGTPVDVPVAEPAGRGGERDLWRDCWDYTPSRRR